MNFQVVFHYNWNAEYIARGGEKLPFTVGKKYTVLSPTHPAPPENAGNEPGFYWICDDNGLIQWRAVGWFISVEDIREEKLRNLLK